jgi:UDP-N-acetylmuramoyl-tripeptide--D-alanyl-D-alanine ligase
MVISSPTKRHHPLKALAQTYFSPFVLWYFKTIARMALSFSRATIIGIAGSVGKTSTREALYAILRDIAPTHMVAGNSETGVPLGLVGLFPHDYTPFDWARMMIAAPLHIGFLKNKRYIIIEMGIDDPYPPKNMEYLLTIVKPDIGIITEESAAHTMQFEKILRLNVVISDTERLKLLIKAITKEDAKMVKQHRCTLGIINGDNPYLTDEFKGSKKNILSFGSSTDSIIRLTEYTVNTNKTTFTYILGNASINLQFRQYAFPKEFAYVFAPAILAAYKLTIPLDVIQKKLEKYFAPPRGRGSLFNGINNSIIIDSSYNASKPSVISFLKLIQQIKKETKRRAVVVLADMAELGNESQIEHEAVAREVAQVADTLYCVGPLMKRFVIPIVDKQKRKPEDIRWFETHTELNGALSNLPEKSLILFKGSQGNFWLEESIKLLLKNKEDISRLCRQNAFWQRVKKSAGRWVDVQ